MRRPQQQPMGASEQKFPAPVAGWIASENIANSSGMGAEVLRNAFPTQNSIMPRGGAVRFAEIASGPVESLFGYQSGEIDLFFAANETAVFDVTSRTSEGIVSPQVVGGRTSGDYSTVQMGLVGGEFLVCVNGADEGLVFDGADWLPWGSGTYAITGVDTSDLSFIWKYANRLFAIRKDSNEVFFLSPDVIAGEMKRFSLAGVFQQGGNLLLGATWSLDSGDGLDDKCVFVSTTGEVAVYRGTDPGDVNNWSIDGRYQIGKPLGPRAIMRAGGEFVIATEGGLVPISEAIRKDPAALSLNAISRAIEPVWVDETKKRAGGRFELVKWDQENKAVVMLPCDRPDWSQRAFVVNVETGAWCEYTGWDMRCTGIYDRFAFYGDGQGRIMQMEAGGNDNGEPYTATIVYQYSDLGDNGREKTCKMLRSICRSSVPPKLKAGVARDYSLTPQTPPASIPTYAGSKWGSALWGVSEWGQDSARENTYQRWHSVERSGFSFAPVIQATYNIAPRPDLQILAVTMTYTTGSLVQ